MSDRMDRFWARGRVEGRGLLRDDIMRGTGGGPISSVRTGLGRTAKQAETSAARIGGLARAAFGRVPVEPLPTSETDPAARFQAAARHYRVAPTELAYTQDNTFRLFMLYMYVALGFVGLNLATWWSYAGDALTVLGRLAPMLLAFVLALRPAFGNWQIRRQRLDSFMAFLRRPAEWWPEPSSGSRTNPGIRSAATMSLLMTAGMSMWILADAPVAHADPSIADTLLAKPTSGDMWAKLLSFVVPGVGPIGGQATPISNGIASGFGAMISVLMALACMMMIYQTVHALVDTAHTGEVMGGNRKWHQTWAPLRVVYGFAALAPVAKGFCALQVLVVYVAVASGQMGNMIWAGFLDGLTTPSTASAPSLPQTMQTVRDITQAEVCHHTVAAVNRDLGIRQPTWPTTYTRGSANSYQFGASRIWYWIKDAWNGQPTTPDPYKVYQVSWDYGRCGRITGQYALDDSKLGPLATQQIKAFDDLRTALHGVGEVIAAGKIAPITPNPNAGSDMVSREDLFERVVTAKTAYDTAITSAVTSFVSGASQTDFATFKAAAKEAGWPSAGAYYMTVARINSNQLEMMTNAPSVSLDRLDGSSDDGYVAKALHDPVTGTLTTFLAWWQGSVEAPSSSLSVSAARAGSYDEGNSIHGIATSALASDGAVWKAMMDTMRLDPMNFDGIQQMQNLGDAIIVTGQTAMTVIVGAKVASAVFPASRAVGVGSKIAGKITGLLGAGSGPLVSFLAIFLFMLVGSIMLFGIYLSLILPLLPFIHFTFAMMGILILVVEGVIAGPLWAFMHCRMEGQDFIDGAQKAGYQILFNILFRIPLTLFGLLYSLLVFNAMVWLLAVTLYPAMAAATSGSMFGLISVVTYIVVISALNHQVAQRSFHLITQVPDRVTRWFGASDSSAEHHEAKSAVGIISGSVRQGLDGGQKALQGGALGKNDGKGDAGASKLSQVAGGDKGVASAVNQQGKSISKAVGQAGGGTEGEGR